jgi:hypothetical protein
MFDLKKPRHISTLPSSLVKQDTTLVVVFSNDGYVIARRSLAAAIRMLCLRGDDLRAGDALRVLAPR